MKNEAVIVHRLSMEGQIFISLNDFIKLLQRHIEYNTDQPYAVYLEEIKNDFILLRKKKEEEIMGEHGEEVDDVMYPLQGAVAGVVDMYKETEGYKKTAYASVYNLLKQLQGLDNINLN